MRIEPDASIATMDDAIVKLLPALGMAARAIGGKVAGDAKKLAADKVAQKTQELTEAKEEEAMAQNQPEEEQDKMPSEATAGANITGLSGNENEGTPTDQPGTEATPRVPLSKTYFKDNFGRSGDEIIKLMVDNGEESIVPMLINLLKQEQQAILSSFPWWQDSDWSHINMRDNDFNLLAIHGERLEIPLRKAIVASRKANENERVAIWEQWSSRLDAESRLSKRERDVLEKASDLIDKMGDMGAQTMTYNDVKATPTEIAMLLKSHGFLYGIKVVGKGKRHDSRGSLYGKDKPPILLKTAQPFIANLWDLGGQIEITPSGTPRMVLPFESKRGAEYGVVLKEMLGVQNIMWEGSQFVIEGDYDVLSVVKQVSPYLHENKDNATILIKAYEGDDSAIRLLTYTYAPKQQQVDLLKSWGMSEDALRKTIAEVVDDE